MIKFIRLFLLILVCNNLIAQNSTVKIDSIKDLLAEKQVYKLKVERLQKLSDLYRNINLDSFSKYSKEIYEISKLKNYSKGYAIYYNGLSKMNFKKGNFSESIVYADKASLYSKKINDSIEYMIAQGMKGAALIHTNDYKKAESVVKNVLNYSKKNKNYEMRGHLFTVLTDYYSNVNEFKKALTSLEQASVMFRLAGSKIGVIGVYQYMADIYHDTEQYDMALRYSKEALRLREKGKDKGDLYNFIVNKYSVAEIYISMKDYKKALIYLLEANKEMSGFDNPAFKRAVYENMSVCYYGLNSYKKALYYVDKAATTDRVERPEVKINMLKGKIYFKLGNLNLSKKHLILAIRLSDEKEIDVESETYSLLSDIESKLGNYEKGLVYLKKANNLEIDRLKEINNKDLNKLKVKFELNEKEIELKNNIIENKKKESELSQEKKKFAIISIILIANILILLILFGFYRSNKRKKELLRKTNSIILSKNAKLEISQKIIQQSLKEKEVLLREIHHRVKNNLQVILSLLNIQARKNNTVEVLDFVEKGQSRIIAMSMIHQNLYNSDNLTKVDFGNYMENLGQAICSTFNIDSTKINLLIHSNDVSFDIQTAIPLGLITNELICNSIKYAFKNKEVGTISISLKKEEDFFELLFTDDGVGNYESELGKKNGSLGIELIHLLVRQLKGTLDYTISSGRSYTIKFKEVAV